MKENYMTRADFCDTAKLIVTSDRNKQYGEPEDNFAVIGELWSTYLTHRWGANGQKVELAPDDVALMMTLFKLGRAITAIEVKDDTFIDAIGYLACGGERNARYRAELDAELERRITEARRSAAAMPEEIRRSAKVDFGEVIDSVDAGAKKEEKR